MEIKYAASQGPHKSATWTFQDTTVHHTLCGCRHEVAKK